MLLVLAQTKMMIGCKLLSNGTNFILMLLARRFKLIRKLEKGFLARCNWANTNKW